jgi:hypothetical protein
VHIFEPLKKKEANVFTPLQLYEFCLFHHLIHPSKLQSQSHSLDIGSNMGEHKTIVGRVRAPEGTTKLRFEKARQNFQLTKYHFNTFVTSLNIISVNFF